MLARIMQLRRGDLDNYIPDYRGYPLVIRMRLVRRWVEK